MNFKQLFSIPNLLCYFRIGMIPVFAYTYLQAETSADYLSSALILGIMEFTDFLDGFIARKYHMVTEAGKIIDPIADKLLQLTLLLLIVIRNPFAAVVPSAASSRSSANAGWTAHCGAEKYPRPCFISAWPCSSSSQGSITPWQTSCCASPPRSCYILSSSI